MSILTKCLCCDRGNLELVIDLGDQVPANAFHDNTQIQTKLPLRLVRCLNCTHLQLDYLADVSEIYTNYKYSTSISKPLCAHFDELSENLSGKVLEIGCNDGYLLRQLIKRGCQVTGVDPAKSFEAQQKGLNIIREFWPTKDPLPDKYNYIIATNVIGHMTDPGAALLACMQHLAPNGTVIIEVHNAESVIVKGQFDTIYHEHISYFTIRSMRALAESYGLHIHHIEWPTMHGGLLRFYLSKEKNVFAFIDYWADNLKLFKEYPKRIKAIGNKLKEYLTPETIGFCASAKLSTLIQTFKLNLKLVVDETPDKIGKYMAGTSIPVVGIDNLDKHILNGCWNYNSAIKQKLKVLAPGTILINYYPEISIEVV